MGIAKTSRKGKKAWRKNIDATEEEAFLEQQSTASRRAPVVSTLKDDELFVLDAAPDASAVPVSLRKQRRGEAKPLRAQLILDSLRHGITPVPSGPKRKQKGEGRPLPGSSTAAAAAAAAQAGASAAQAQRGSRGRKRKHGTQLLDIWAENGASGDQPLQQDWAAPTPGTELLRLAKAQGAAAAAVPHNAKQQQQQRQRHSGKPRAGRGRNGAPVPVPAVEVDQPGCSFNPDYEAHQDAIAAAVAREYKRQLRQELAPSAPSLHAPADYKAPEDELDALLNEAGGSSEEEEEDEEGQQQQQHLVVPDENAIALDDDDEDDGVAAVGCGGDAGGMVGAAAGVERKTRRDRNREARRRAADADASVKAIIKRQRQQLDALPELQAQLEEEEAARELMRTRRRLAAEEKAATAPPRLGKHRFEAPPTAVLTSDDVTGSLRQLRPCFTIAAERFASLQKRGLIEPRRPAGRRKGKRIEYVTGERRELAEERQREVNDMAAARRHAAKTGASAAGTRRSRAPAPVMLPLEVEGW